jgi:hypothetical protein
MEARSTARREKCEMNFRNNLTAFSWKVFVAKSQCPDALTQKLGHLVFDQARQPIVRKTPRQSLNESHPQVHSPQKHRPAVAAEVAPGKIRRHFPASVGLKLENLLLTLCHSEVLLVDCSNANNLSGLGRELRYFFCPRVSFPA